MSIIIGGERMSQFYCREAELRKLNKRYAGDILHSLCKMSILFCIISQSVLQNQWYLTLYTQILFSSTNLYLPGPFPLTLCIICAAFIAFMIQQHLLELGDINDASGVFFVIKRLGVVIIINNRLVQNRFPVVILRMSDFNTL